MNKMDLDTKELIGRAFDMAAESVPDDASLENCEP